MKWDKKGTKGGRMTKEDIKIKAFGYRYFIYNIVKNEFFWWSRGEIEDIVYDVLEYFYNIVDRRELNTKGIITYLQNLTLWLIKNRKKNYNRKGKLDEIEYLYLRSKNEKQAELLEEQKKALIALEKIKLRSKYQLYTLKDVYLHLIKNNVIESSKKFRVARKTIYKYMRKMAKVPQVRDYFEYIEEYETIMHDYYIAQDMHQRIIPELVNSDYQKKRRKYIKKEKENAC